MASLRISRTSSLSLALGLRRCPPRCRDTLSLRCRLPDDGETLQWEEPPEMLFMKELKRRGITPSSLLEEKEVEATRDGDQMLVKEYEKRVASEAERSQEMNSERIEGLIPQAKLLLTIGGTITLGFWPLMVISIAFFAILYCFLGSSFEHDASKMPITSSIYRSIHAA